MTLRARSSSLLARFSFSGLALLGTLALHAGEAEASGIGTARFGGEHGHPTTENPTGIYYNPGAIALSKGTNIFVDGTIAFRGITYTRPDSAVDPQPGGTNNVSLDYANGANNGTNKLFNVVGAPFIGATSDFGTDFFYAGLSLSVPFGGGSTWKKNEAFSDSAQFPGAVDGPQRWHTIDGTIRSFYFTGAVAFKIKAAKMTIGVSGSAIRSSIDTIRARNPDGTDNLVSGNSEDMFALKEGRSWLKADGWQGGFAAGVTFEPLDNKLWIGASYTSQPNVAGGMTLKGTLTNIFATGQPSETKIELTQTLPDIVRLGFRVRPIPKLEIRLYADYTRWSVFDKQCILDAKEPGRKCEFDNPENAIDDPTNFGGIGPNVKGVAQHLPRYWKDAGGVRLGVGYFFLDNLEAYVGLGYDSSAIPVQTADPSLFDMNKFSISLGTLWQAHKRVAMGVTLTQLIYMKMDTKGQNALAKYQAPTRQPDANGVYKQWLTVGNLYLQFSF
ncbi:OmpP1/FadL family transporter [Nannocystaceae bacterium ST9]